MAKKLITFSTLIPFLILLSACSSFTGIRTPRYDGRPMETNPEKIAAFATSKEIIGQEKALYLPETISQDIAKPSLEYEDHEPVLLEAGTYLIGEDLPAGRVSLNGEKENPRLVFPDTEYIPGAPKPIEEYQVGTMYIRDEAGDLYFEHMFHPNYGVTQAQVDFIPGHTIEIIGSQPGIVAFYTPEIPEDPYIFDTRQAEFDAQFEEMELVESFESESAGDVEVNFFEPEQPLKISEDGTEIEVKSGIFEVGKHFEPGTYTMTDGASPTHTEIYLFREGKEPRVFEVANFIYTRPWLLEGLDDPSAPPPTIELQIGDKIYFTYLGHLRLTRVED